MGEMKTSSSALSVVWNEMNPPQVTMHILYNFNPVGGRPQPRCDEIILVLDKTNGGPILTSPTFAFLWLLDPGYEIKCF